ARLTSGGNKERSRKSYVCNGQNLHFSKLAVLRERPVANRGGLRPVDRNGSGRGTPHLVGAGSGVVLPSLGTLRDPQSCSDRHERQLRRGCRKRRRILSRCS